MKNRRKAVQPFEIKKRKIDIFRNYEAYGFEKNQRKFENFSTLISKKSNFSLSWMDTGPNSDLIINLGSANEAYKGDLLNESRTTLSNLTLVLNEGLLNNFSGTIVGEGVFTKRGLGILNFSGSNHSMGTTRVEEGVLLANGYFASDVSVLAAGRLGGSGRINGSLNNGGIVSPGNNIGTNIDR